MVQTFDSLPASVAITWLLLERLSNAVEAGAEALGQKAFDPPPAWPHWGQLALGPSGPVKSQITAMSMGKAIANAPRATTRRSLVDWFMIFFQISPKKNYISGDSYGKAKGRMTTDPVTIPYNDIK